MKAAIAATVEGVRTRKDKTLAITVGTQELSPEQGGQLLSLTGHLVSVYISDKGIPQDEIDKVDKIDPVLGGKTQSERIRNTLYILFTQDSQGHKTFDEYYHARTEKLIELLKGQLK